MIITLDLTESQAEKLYRATQDYQDEGPYSEGWQSDELEEVARIVSEARNKAKE